MIGFATLLMVGDAATWLRVRYPSLADLNGVTWATFKAALLEQFKPAD